MKRTVMVEIDPANYSGVEDSAAGALLLVMDALQAISPSSSRPYILCENLYLGKPVLPKEKT